MHCVEPWSRIRPRTVIQFCHVIKCRSTVTIGTRHIRWVCRFRLNDTVCCPSIYLDIVVSRFDAKSKRFDVSPMSLVGQQLSLSSHLIARLTVRINWFYWSMKFHLNAAGLDFESAISTAYLTLFGSDVIHTERKNVWPTLRKEHLDARDWRSFAFKEISYLLNKLYALIQ